MDKPETKVNLHPVVNECIDNYAKYYAEHHKLGLSIRDDMRYVAQVATRWAHQAQPVQSPDWIGAAIDAHISSALGDPQPELPEGVALVSRNQIIHLQEYWNGSRNDSAMWDALNHIMDELQAMLAATTSPT